MCYAIIEVTHFDKTKSQKRCEDLTDLNAKLIEVQAHTGVTKIEVFKSTQTFKKSTVWTGEAAIGQPQSPSPS